LKILYVGETTNILDLAGSFESCFKIHYGTMQLFPPPVPAKQAVIRLVEFKAAD
jgi:hypothetical protein